MYDRPARVVPAPLAGHDLAVQRRDRSATRRLPPNHPANSVRCDTRAGFPICIADRRGLCGATFSWLDVLILFYQLSIVISEQKNHQVGQAQHVVLCADRRPAGAEKRRNGAQIPLKLNIIAVYGAFAGGLWEVIGRFFRGIPEISPAISTRWEVGRYILTFYIWRVI